MSRSTPTTRCHYEVLGVQTTATSTELKAAWRRLALEWHPDKHMAGSSERVAEANVRFKELMAAYDVLGNPTRRAHYDACRQTGVRYSHPSGGCHYNSDYGDDDPYYYNDYDEDYDDDDDEFFDHDGEHFRYHWGAGRGEEEEEEEDQADLLFDLDSYTTTMCYSGRGDDERGFYGVYGRLFASLAEAERLAGNPNLPSFGTSTSPWEEVDRFYQAWRHFSTKRQFNASWINFYGIRIRGKGDLAKKMEFESRVARLLHWVEKFDTRVSDHKEEARRAEKEAKAAYGAKLRQEREAKGRSRKGNRKQNKSKDHRHSRTSTSTSTTTSSSSNTHFTTTTTTTTTSSGSSTTTTTTTSFSSSYSRG